MPLEIPKSVRLAGRVFPIEIRTDDEFCDEKSGAYRGQLGKIELCGHTCPEQMKATMLHEIMHDLDEQSLTKLTERDITFLSALLFAALRDNPDLVAWIMES